MVLLAYPHAKLLDRYVRNDSGTDIKNGMAIYLPIMLIMGMMGFLIQTFTRGMLHIVNTNMAENIRSKLYNSMIAQPTEFYDQKDHNTGNLTAILSSSVRELNGSSIELYIYLFGTIFEMLTGIIMVYVFEWNFGLLVTGIIPVCCFSLACTYALQYGSQSGTREKENKQQKMVSDYILNNSTVASLANEGHIIKNYFSENGVDLQFKPSREILNE